MDTYSGIKFWEQIQLNWNKQGQHATNNASIMCINGCVGCGVGGSGISGNDGAGCNDGGDDSGGDDIVAFAWNISPFRC